MGIFLLVIILVGTLWCYYVFLKIRSLRGEPQIYAEVASELQQRAHELLVRKDHIEAHGPQTMADENERWKNDLAQYMEDYEQEALARRRLHLGR